MKTAKEFVERLQKDEAFAKEVNEKIQAKKAAGAKDYTEALLPVAAELGYEITKEQVEALKAKQSEVISEEELGKAAGGTSCVAATVGISISAALSVGASAAATVMTAGTFNSSHSC